MKPPPLKGGKIMLSRVQKSESLNPPFREDLGGLCIKTVQFCIENELLRIFLYNYYIVNHLVFSPAYDWGEFPVTGKSSARMFDGWQEA